MNEKESLAKEIKARKLVLKRMESVLKRAREAGAKKAQERKESLLRLTEYKTRGELEDAYGWECITEEEFRRGLDLLEGIESPEERSPEEWAADIIGEWVAGLNKEVRSFEWELLSPEEQERIVQQNEQLQEKIRKRRCGHGRKN